jgi:hypothetical protein
MNKFILLVLFSPFLLSAQISNPQVLSKIGFGSCISQNDSQKIWYKVIEKAT